MKNHSKHKTIVLSLFILLFGTTILLADAKPGLLVVHPDNPRYLMVKGDKAKKAMLLSGAHTWAEFQTYKDEKFDYTDWISKLVGWNHNFMRGWMWEDDYYSPLPLVKVGDKYDLTKYNPAYFDRLKKRLREAARKNLYVSVMLFEGWSVIGKKHGRSPMAWPRHPYHKDNNINGINGDPNGDGKGSEVHSLQISAITKLQEAYVKHFIDQLNGFDNIVWEIGNECNRESIKWQYHMIDFIKKYEAKKPKQHLVWINFGYKEVFDPKCHADIVSPGGSRAFINNPPATTGKKVVIADSDHLGPLSVTFDLMWQWFTRGMHPILMDCKYQNLAWWGGSSFQREHTKWQKMRDALGTMQTYADKMNLVKMVPQNEKSNSPSSTRYCLYNKGKEYIIFQPAREKAFTVDLPAGKYAYEWIIPTTGKERAGAIEWKGGKKSFTAPFPWPAGLYLKQAAAGR